MSILITVIIPCYNVESCVEDMLFSLSINQDPTIEFIIINDGSSDNTESIINNFINKYPIMNLRIENINNIGLSSVRNKGVQLAQGEFVWFLDGDDALVSGSISKLLKFIEDYPEHELFVFEGYDFEDRELGYNPENYQESNGWLIEAFHRDVTGTTLISSSKYIQTRIQEGNYLSNACFYIVKMDILLERGIAFLPNAVYEDVLFTAHLFLNNLKSVIINQRFILHRRRNGSITRSNLTKHHLDSYYKINNELFQLIKRYSYYRSELLNLIEIYLKLGLRRTRDNNYSVFPYLFKYFSLFFATIRTFPSIRQEVYKNIKYSVKLLLK